MSFGHVALELGCHRSHPYQWETGKRLPPARLLEPLAALYGIRPRQLLAAWIEAELEQRHGLRATVSVKAFGRAGGDDEQR
jgi:transcriptional regulator with XRE-family HTH domain